MCAKVIGKDILSIFLFILFSVLAIVSQFCNTHNVLQLLKSLAFL